MEEKIKPVECRRRFSNRRCIYAPTVGATGRSPLPFAAAGLPSEGRTSVRPYRVTPLRGKILRFFLTPGRSYVINSAGSGRLKAAKGRVFSIFDNCIVKVKGHGDYRNIVAGNP